MRVALYGGRGRSASLLGPALIEAGHEVVDGREQGPAGCDVAIDFTRPTRSAANVRACLAERVPVVIGTTRLRRRGRRRRSARKRECRASTRRTSRSAPS